MRGIAAARPHSRYCRRGRNIVCVHRWCPREPSMTDRRRPSCQYATTLCSFIALFTLNASASPGDAASHSAAPGVSPPKEFSAVRGDRTSGWLPQTRSEVLARNGVVATSQPLAAQAGLQMLKQGGNAFDAAVATAAALNVVEPVSAGVGGDVFVIAWVAKDKKLIALNASGRAPSGATPQNTGEGGFTKKM